MDFRCSFFIKMVHLSVAGKQRTPHNAMLSFVQQKQEKREFMMNNLMKQAQKMQRQMEEAQKQLEDAEVTAKAGGGAVEVTVSGKKEITKVKLSEEVVDPDDIEMLEDLIMAATNEALRQIDEQSQASMSKITGGLGGGLF